MKTVFTLMLMIVLASSTSLHSALSSRAALMGQETKKTTSPRDSVLSEIRESDVKALAETYSGSEAAGGLVEAEQFWGTQHCFWLCVAGLIGCAWAFVCHYA